MLSTNELMELMKKARIQSRPGYDQIHALRFLITFKRNKRKYSEAEFRSIAAAKGVDLGGYQNHRALLNQGRYIFRRLELITDRDLSKEIEPLPMFEDPELFPAEETAEPELFPAEETAEPELFPAEETAEPAEKTRLDHVEHIASTVDTISLKMNELLGKIDTLIELETRALKIMREARE